LNGLKRLRVDLSKSMNIVVGVDLGAARIDMRTAMRVDKSIVVLSRCLLMAGTCVRRWTALLSGSLIADQSSRVTLNSGTGNRRLE
jgi:hypothetical protein